MGYARMAGENGVRLVMCKGRHCNADGHAEGLYAILCRVLGEPADFTQRHKLVRWEVANCLSHCDIGPNFVFYPDGEWFHHSDESTVADIIERYREAQMALGVVED